jgi:hypothetical protein
MTPLHVKIAALRYVLLHPAVMAVLEEPKVRQSHEFGCKGDSPHAPAAIRRCRCFGPSTRHTNTFRRPSAGSGGRRLWGPPEALDPRDEEFGEDRIWEILQQFGNLQVDALASHLASERKTWIADDAQYDDLAFILVKVS